MNENLLSNITLGSEVYESAFNSLKASGYLLELLFMKQSCPANYNSVKDQKLMAVIGDLPSPSTIQIANIRNACKIPQVLGLIEMRTMYSKWVADEKLYGHRKNKNSKKRVVKYWPPLKMFSWFLYDRNMLSMSHHCNSSDP